MSILVNKDTRVVFQGITGESGALHAKACIAYGTKVVAGVTPGKGGTKHLNLPVFDTVSDAVCDPIRRLVPTVFGGVGAAFGIGPVFWINAAVIAAGNWYSRRREPAG